MRCPDAQLWLSTSNFACNSPATISNSDFTALKSQRFYTLLNLHPIELHATFEEGLAPLPTGMAAGTSGALHAGGGGGFAALEAGWQRVAGVSWF